MKPGKDYRVGGEGEGEDDGIGKIKVEGTTRALLRERLVVRTSVHGNFSPVVRLI